MSFERRARIRVWCEDASTSAWVLVPSNAISVANVARSVVGKLGLAQTDGGYELFLNDSPLLSSESVDLIRDGDHISVRPRVTRELSNRVRFLSSTADPAAAVDTVDLKPQPDLNLTQNIPTCSIDNKRALEEAPAYVHAKKMKLAFHSANGISISPAAERSSVERSPHDTFNIPKRSPPAPVLSNIKSAALKSPTHAPSFRNPIIEMPSLSKLAISRPSQTTQPLSSNAFSKPLLPEKLISPNPSLIKPPLSKHLGQKPPISEPPASNLTVNPPVPEPPSSSPTNTGLSLPNHSDSKLKFRVPPVTRPPFSKPQVLMSLSLKRSPIRPPNLNPSLPNTPFPEPLLPNSPVSKSPVSVPQLSKPSVSISQLPKPPMSMSQLSKPQVTKPQLSKPPISMPQLSKPSSPKLLSPKIAVPKPLISKPKLSKPHLPNPPLPKPVTPKYLRSKPPGASYVSTLGPMQSPAYKPLTKCADQSIQQDMKPSKSTSTRVELASDIDGDRVGNCTATPVTPIQPRRNPPILRSKPISSSLNRQAKDFPEGIQPISTTPNELSSMSRSQKPRIIAKFARPSFMEYAPKSAEKSRENVIDVDRLETLDDCKNKLLNPKSVVTIRTKRGGNERNGITNIRDNFSSEEYQSESRIPELLPDESKLMQTTSVADNQASSSAREAKSQNVPSIVLNDKKSNWKKPGSSNRKTSTKPDESGSVENKSIGRNWTILDVLKKKAKESNGQDLFCQAQVHIESSEGGRRQSGWIQFMLKTNPTARNELQLSIVNTDALQVLQKVGRDAKQRIPGTASVKTGANLRPDMPILLNAGAISMFTFDQKSSDRKASDTPIKQSVSFLKQSVDKKGTSKKESLLGKLAALSKTPYMRRKSSLTKKSRQNSSVSDPIILSPSPQGSFSRRTPKNNQIQSPPAPIFSVPEPMELLSFNPAYPSDALGNDNCEETNNMDMQLAYAPDVSHVQPQANQTEPLLQTADPLSLDDLPHMDELPVPSADDLRLAGDDILPSLAALESVLDTGRDEKKGGKFGAKVVHVDVLQAPISSADYKIDNGRKAVKLTQISGPASVPIVQSPNNVIDLVESDSGEPVPNVQPATENNEPHLDVFDFSVSDYGRQMLEVLSDVANTLGVLTSRKDLYID